MYRGQLEKLTETTRLFSGRVQGALWRVSRPITITNCQKERFQI